MGLDCRTLDVGGCMKIPRLSTWLFVMIVGLLTVVLAIVDYETGIDFDFLIFYLIPLFIVTWRLGPGVGYGYAVLGVALNAAADRLSHPVYTYPSFFYVNLVEDICVLALFVAMLTRLKVALRKVRDVNDQLEGANRDLQEAIQMKDEFLNIAAHDLKNPLTSILGLSELMVQPDLKPKPEDNLEDARSIHQSARQMLDLIRNLLDAARHESRRLEPVPEQLDLAALTHRLVQQNAKLAARKNIILNNGVGGTAMVWADPSMTEQVLDNLISNAVKFSPAGKNVYLRSRVENHDLLWEVRDQGPGVSAEDRKRLFQKFARLSAQPTGGENSTGLGLSIVKMMAEAMGGRVWCESEPGRGATFIVALPRESPAGAAGRL